MQYGDVVIHNNADIFGKETELQQFPPVEQRIDLSDSIWIGRLDLEVAKAIMDTCEPKTLGIYPARQAVRATIFYGAGASFCCG